MLCPYGGCKVSDDFLRYSKDMLTLALPLLLSAAPHQPAASDLMAAIPENAVVAFHMPNPKAVVAARETNDLVAFMMDPEWESIAGLLMDMDDPEEAAGLNQLKGLRDRAIEAMTDCSGLVMFATTLPETGEPMSIGVVARGGPKVAEMIQEMFVDEQASTEQLQPSLIARTSVPRAGRFNRAFATSGDLIIGVESWDGMDTARAMVRESLGRGAQRPGGPFGLPTLAKERKACAFEFAVNLDPILKAARSEGFNSPMEERMFDMAFDGMTWIYGSMALGSGETTDADVVVPYGAESALAGLFSNFGQADINAFAGIPAEAHTAQVGNVDLEGIFGWAMDLVKGESEEGYEQIMAGINGITEMSGINVIEDVLGNLSGPSVAFSTTRPVSEEPTMMDMMMVSTFSGNDMTYAVEVEDTEVLLEALEFMVDMSGMGEMLLSGTATGGGESGEFETWSLDPEIGSLKLALGAGHMILSTNSQVLDRYLSTFGTELGESFASNEKVAVILPTLSGAGISIQKTAAMLESISTMVDGFEAMFSNTVDLSAFEGGEMAGASIDDTFSRMSLAADRVVELGRRYFEGTMSSDMVMENGQLRLRQRTR